MQALYFYLLIFGFTVITAAALFVLAWLIKAIFIDRLGNWLGNWLVEQSIILEGKKLMPNRNLINQAKKLGFAVKEPFQFFANRPEDKQWKKNIEESDFLKYIFGNWKTIHGQLIPGSIRGSFKYKDYEIELLQFYIYTETKTYNYLDQTNSTEIVKAGPYTGLHFNLHKEHPEVDIVYKYTHPLEKFMEKIYGERTIKPRRWQTESPEFNKKYSIISKEHTTNLTVLTPDIMAKLLDSNLNLNIEIIKKHLLLYTLKKFKGDNDVKENCSHIISGIYFPI